MLTGDIPIGKLLQLYVDTSKVREYVTGISKKKKDGHVIMTEIAKSPGPIDYSHYKNSEKTPSGQPVIINLSYIKRFEIL